MFRIRPFQAIRPSAARVREFSTPRLDHLSEAQRQAIAGRAPRGLAAALDAGATLVRELVESRALIRHGEPAMFMHRQVREGRTGVGLLACLDLVAFQSGAARAHRRAHHERAREWRDRLQRLQAHADPVVVGFDATDEMLDLFEREMNDRPLFHVVADDGATHTLWLGTRAEALAQLFTGVREAILLEGHHRAMGADDAEEALVLLVPLRDVTVRASVAMLPASAVEGILRTGQALPASETGSPTAGQAWACAPDAGNGGVTWKSLRVPESFAEAVTAIEGWSSAGACQWRPGISMDRSAIEALVRKGEAGVAVVMADPAIEALRALGAAGALLPPGSTWCDPAFRSGLCMAEMRAPAPTMGR